MKDCVYIFWKEDGVEGRKKGGQGGHSGVKCGEAWSDRWGELCVLKYKLHSHVHEQTTADDALHWSEWQPASQPTR